jgi:phosphatidylglycerol:prolipoprotein diacylglycerol transferase
MQDIHVIFHIIGMIVAIVLVHRRAQRAGVRLGGIRFLIGAVCVIALGVAGSRLAYVVADLPYYTVHWTEIFSLHGTIIQGALIFGMLGVLPLAWFLRISFWKLVDLFVPGVALAQAIGRIGCIVAGCCAGIPVQLPGLAQMGWVYPTQTMHGVSNLLICWLLLFLDDHDYKPFDGFLFLLYMILFSTQRWLIDFLRAAGPVFAPGMFLEGVRVPRVISAVSIVLSLIVLVWRWALLKRRAASISDDADFA